MKLNDARHSVINLMNVNFLYLGERLQGPEEGGTRLYIGFSSVEEVASLYPFLYSSYDLAQRDFLLIEEYMAMRESA